MNNQKTLEGLILGREGESFITSENRNHIILCGPSGSGKGVGFVVPNLLNWKHSAIVHDVTGENFEVTSGFRKEVLGHEVYLWNPGSEGGFSHCYNPFDWVSRDINQQVDDVQKIASIILPEDEFWSNEARSLLTGITLYLLSIPEKNTSFSEIFKVLRNDDVIYNLAVILDNYGPQIHPVSYKEIAHFLLKADSERSAVLSTLSSAISVCLNPKIEALTSHSDFDLRKLKEGNMTLYITIDLDDLKRLRPLVHIFYNQVISALCSERAKHDDKSPVLMMMDDFISFGELKDFDFNINFLRHYNVKFCSILQNYGQLRYMYPNDSNSFFANSGYRISYTTNDRVTNTAFVEDAYIEENGNVRELTKLELANLSIDKELLLTESEPAKIVDKICYYKDPFFKDKILQKAVIPKQEFPEYGETESTKKPDDSNVSYLSLVHDSEKDDKGDGD